MKTFLIHCWDVYANGRLVEIKAHNEKTAEKKFKTRFPRWFIVRIEEVNCK